MQWNQAKDILMMREVAFEGVLQHKSGSKERGQGWQKVADVLNTLGGFTVNNRGVRDRLTNLMKKFKTLINKDKQLTGFGGDEPTEFEVLIEELILLNDDTEAKCEEDLQHKKTTAEADRNKALEIRASAMERYGETRKRVSEDDDEATPKRRRSASDTVTFLREKLENDKEVRQQEKQDRLTDKREQQEFMQLQQRQHMEMQQQMVAMIAQQSALLKTIIEKK